jgi:hypothetical protein
VGFFAADYADYAEKSLLWLAVLPFESLNEFRLRK